MVFNFLAGKKAKLEYLKVFLFINSHNNEILFTVGRKGVYFRTSLPKKKRRTGLSAKLLKWDCPLHFKGFVSLGKVEFKTLIQVLFLSFACFLVNKTLKKDNMVGSYSDTNACNYRRTWGMFGIGNVSSDSC